MIDKVRAYLDHREDVLLAFVFGSYASGRAREDSDLDVAVYMKYPLCGGDKSIKDELESLSGKMVDLVVLNGMDPIISMEVLQNGIPVKMDDKTYRVFFAKTVSMYEDIKIIRKEAEEKLVGFFS